MCTFWCKSGAVFKFAQKWRNNQDWRSKCADTVGRSDPYFAIKMLLDNTYVLLSLLEFKCNHLTIHYDFTR